MKNVRAIFISSVLVTLCYMLFLALLPLKKTVFYTNDERCEEYVYSETYYPIVLVGSSLSGAFESKMLFTTPYFNLYLPFTGSCSGIEIIRRSKKYPKVLFVEINEIYRGIDTNLITQTFKSPLSNLKYHLPFLLKKNKLFPNLIDRFKKPVAVQLSDQQPPEVLYKQLLLSTQKTWEKPPVLKNWNLQFDQFKETLNLLSIKGTSIWFYEVPMDTSLNHSKLLVFERSIISQLAKDKGYHFLPADLSLTYKTGDGLHLLENDSKHYYHSFLNELLRQTRGSSLKYW